MLLSKEQWAVMVPAITNIDGGCRNCIDRFLTGLMSEGLEISLEMVQSIKIYGKPISEEDYVQMKKRVIKCIERKK